jgi:hypothetical protein
MCTENLDQADLQRRDLAVPMEVNISPTGGFGNKRLDRT